MRHEYAGELGSEISETYLFPAHAPYRWVPMVKCFDKGGEPAMATFFSHAPMDPADRYVTLAIRSPHGEVCISIPAHDSPWAKPVFDAAKKAFDEYMATA
jgi:hypothetical protein